MTESGELLELIPEWLTATQGADLPTGLSREEALRRARELRRLIRDGRISYSLVDVDEEGKDVLYALVGLLAEPSDEGTDTVANEADAIYRFMRGLEWSPDALAEKNELLRKCAVLGWQVRGSDPAAITRDRHELMCRQEPAILACAEKLLNEPSSEQPVKRETVFAACFLLRARSDDEPMQTLQRASGLSNLLCRGEPVGLLDESDYLLGVACLWAGTAARILGRFDHARRWLNAAEQRFQRVVNSDSQLTKLAYARAALLIQSSRYAEALEVLPAIRTRFDQLGMRQDSARAEFAVAMTLNLVGRWREALKILEVLKASPVVNADGVLRVNVDVYLASCLLRLGDRGRAEKLYLTALRSLETDYHPFLAPLLKWAIGDDYRSHNELELALRLYRSALSDHLSLSNRSLAAQIRLTIAETALELGRDFEAEQEILAALPTIEEQKMVPEGFAAVALLKESVRRRKTDPNALRELREHLQATNQK